jgi:glycosyltransferase involved in cell wall biosynthesis
MSSQDVSGGLRIAMIGTRGVPATYGGFETAVEEIGKRLVELGHHVTVYCRSSNSADNAGKYLGMKLVHLPALHMKIAETLSHTFLSVIHAVFSRRYDVAFVFNAANSPFVPLLKLRGIPVAVHVDGLEWKRSKWSGAGRRYYKFAERLSVRWADSLIADATGIADYYRETFGVETENISYGAPILRTSGHEKLAALGLEPHKYHLVVARFEPENHVSVIVDAYAASAARYPLVVVGSAPYAAAYTQQIERTAAQDLRIHLLGGVWDQELLNELYANAFAYLHGHSVGGTNPSLLRAIGCATPVLAFDVNFNREVLGVDGIYFADELTLARQLEGAEKYPEDFAKRGARLQARAEAEYSWSQVARDYERLAVRLAKSEHDVVSIG